MAILAEPASVTGRIFAGDAIAETGLLRNYLRGAAVLSAQYGLQQETACEAVSLVLERIRNGEIRKGSQIANALREAILLLSARPRRPDSSQVYFAKKQAAAVCKRVLERVSEPKHRALIYRLFAGGLTPEEVSGELEIDTDQFKVWVRDTMESFRQEEGGEPLVGVCDASPMAAPRYVLDQLTPAERALFEEHFASCECCAELVLTASRLRSGMPVAAAEEAGALITRESPRFKAARWLAEQPYWTQAAALIAASMVLAVGPSFYFLAKIRSLPAAPTAQQRRVGALAKAASFKEGTQQLPPAPPPIAPAKARPVELAAPLADGAVMLEPSADWVPKSRVKLTGNPMRLQVNRSADKTSASYTASIYSLTGRPVQWDRNLAPSSAGVVSVTIAPEKLTNGIFTLVLEGADAAGQRQPQAKYSFDVVR